MPIHDFFCRKCGATKDDILLPICSEEKIMCDVCGEEMEKKPSSFSFSFTPGQISKYKKRYGRSVPPDYKTGAQANVYGIPRKR